MNFYCVVFSISTHFLTGDGGFIQSVMMGYAGLRFDEKGLLFDPLPGVLSPATKAIRLRNLLIRGTYPIDYTIDASAVHFVTSSEYTDLLCVTDTRGHQWRITTTQSTVPFEDISLPMRFDSCA